MFMQSSNSMLRPVLGMLRIAVLNALVMAAPILAVAGDSGHDHAPATLVQIVRANTAQFINVNNLNGTGYAPLFATGFNKLKLNDPAPMKFPRVSIHPSANGEIVLEVKLLSRK